MKRAASAVIFAVISVICVAIPAAGATGPFFIKAQSANICVKVSPDQPGKLVVQGDYTKRDCRKVFFNRAGTSNGHPFGEIQTSAPLDLAAGTTCTSVFLAPHGASGTIWFQYTAETGRQYIVNRYCDDFLGFGSNCVAALSGDGNVGDDWTIEPIGTHGWFQRMAWIVTSRVRHLFTRAGC